MSEPVSALIADHLSEMLDERTRECTGVRQIFARTHGRAGLSSAMCAGCHQAKEPGVEDPNDRVGYVLLAGHINRPWHVSCAEQALSEIDIYRTAAEDAIKALAHALEWLEEEGCDCGTDEPGTCAFCEARRVLERFAPQLERFAPQEKL